MKVAIIVAMDKQGLIGRNNDLPWKLSADLKYFRRVTMGKPLVMGRNTHESIGRALPGRKNIIVTSNTDYQVDGCTVVPSLEQALLACDDAEEVMVMGGASLYEQLLPEVERIYLTHVDVELEGDTWFPQWNKDQWQEISREDHPADEKNQYPYSFVVYDRV
ncbi:dihydrofolate reductase [Methylophaga sp. 42_25_T18]|nr:dihydrofolate reductase [Methylophaga sp. 42_25_T18]OUR86475.1 dihydrofolate reductase [Methylophaga sp. 42_8_T64]